jgi:hypothetical protein
MQENPAAKGTGNRREKGHVKGFGAGFDTEIKAPL